MEMYYQLDRGDENFIVYSLDDAGMPLFETFRSEDEAESFADEVIHEGRDAMIFKKHDSLRGSKQKEEDIPVHQNTACLPPRRYAA